MQCFLNALRIRLMTHEFIFSIFSAEDPYHQAEAYNTLCIPATGDKVMEQCHI